ncbi:integrase domain-containing protein [Vibrio sp. SCSIO 43133]|uniref:integrase domain-containing protein n=1 Tax=Vibrio sp. SCSIO 43133 TaxID=2802577 RepID=UPI0020751C27|nr:integrase domain-containing protein [Vibrio sp. SCSIO 43133]USE01588.1 integrase domain-containing protein [Vibrio sp. SCSIO 43133]
MTKKRKYSGHIRHGLREFSRANFGLWSRDLEKALINASLENQGGIHSNTHRARMPALRCFAAYLKAETTITRLEKIERYVVEQFGIYLKERYEIGEISPRTARDYLSHVNRALAQARGDETRVVNATRELGFVPKQGIATSDQSVSGTLHQKIMQNTSEEVKLVIQLQRAFGLRFREASLLDAKSVLRAFESGKVPIIKRGTKGGQERNLPIFNSEQYKIMLAAAEYQIANDKNSFIPDDKSFRAFQTSAWREFNEVDASYCSHGERRFFACKFYRDYVGVACPVQSNIAHGRAHIEFIADQKGISFEQAKQLDREARQMLSEVLGHHRINITNAYVG